MNMTITPFITKCSAFARVTILNRSMSKIIFKYLMNSSLVTDVPFHTDHFCYKQMSPAFSNDRPSQMQWTYSLLC